MTKETEKTAETSLIRSVLTSEVKFVVGIVVFVFGVASPYYSMKQDIALIKSDISNINTNHEAHIQDIMQNLQGLQTQTNAQQAEIIDLQKQLIVLISKK